MKQWSITDEELTKMAKAIFRLIMASVANFDRR